MASNIKTSNMFWQLAQTDLIEVQSSSNPYSICFFSQQAAEKYLKAFLAYHKQPFPKTHNLSTLLSRCSQIDNSFDVLKHGIVFLNRFAVESRYEVDAQPKDEDCPLAWQTVVAVKNLVACRLPETITKLSDSKEEAFDTESK